MPCNDDIPVPGPDFPEFYPIPWTYENPPLAVAHPNPKPPFNIADFPLPKPNDLELAMGTAVHEHVRKLAEAKDKYLLDIFGSVEVLERVKDDFVFEEYVTETNTSFPTDGSNDFHVSFVTKFRVRAKTEEERLMELADDIGAKIERGILPPQNEFGQYIL